MTILTDKQIDRWVMQKLRGKMKRMWIYRNVIKKVLNPVLLILMYGILGTVVLIIVGHGITWTAKGIWWLGVTFAATKWVLLVIGVGMTIYWATKNIKPMASTDKGGVR